ncbi:MAG: putative molybdenum carrier protein [Verrucomicrobiota bacterium]
MNLDPALPLTKIVSGGQTGADRAALDWAIENGVEHGGWCPRGRRAEDGLIDPRYSLDETTSEAYPVRTKWNVRDSDATVIFTIGSQLTGGSKLTAEFAREFTKPWLHISSVATPDPTMALRRFIDENFVQILNVAGPRDSTEPQVAEFVRDTLNDAILD